MAAIKAPSVKAPKNSKPVSGLSIVLGIVNELRPQHIEFELTELNVGMDHGGVRPAYVIDYKERDTLAKLALVPLDKSPHVLVVTYPMRDPGDLFKQDWHDMHTVADFISLYISLMKTSTDKLVIERERRVSTPVEDKDRVTSKHNPVLEYALSKKYIRTETTVQRIEIDSYIL